MGAENQSRRARLSIDVGPELRRQIELAAAERNVSVCDYVVAILRRALAGERDEASPEARGWAQLSARSFARDWESEEDRAYDRLA